MGKRKRRIDYYNAKNAPQPTTRKPSASVVVRDEHGRVLLLRRTDNDLWTIPTGGLAMNESVRECASRECLEETGIEIETLDLVGVFSDPQHIIAYYHGKNLNEVRQPVNVCLHAKPIGGSLATSNAEASEVRWIGPSELAAMNIHPAIRRRLDHALSAESAAVID
ncbi:MAG: NUDIX domain-containing protein [Nocardioides sp.]